MSELEVLHYTPSMHVTKHLSLVDEETVMHQRSLSSSSKIQQEVNELNCCFEKNSLLCNPMRGDIYINKINPTIPVVSNAIKDRIDVL